MSCLGPSFETAVELVIGPAEGRTRWRPPQDEVSTSEVRTIGRPHPEEPCEARRLEGWPQARHCLLKSHPQASHPEIRRRARLPAPRTGGAGERDAAFLQAIDVIADRERLHDVLLDDDEGSALVHDRRQPGIDVAHHNRCKAEADLIA